MSLDGSSVVRLLDNLEAAGLIQRKEGETDRRAKIILLTARGRAIADKVETVARRDPGRRAGRPVRQGHRDDDPGPATMSAARSTPPPRPAA